MNYTAQIVDLKDCNSFQPDQCQALGFHHVRKPPPAIPASIHFRSAHPGKRRVPWNRRIKGAVLVSLVLKIFCLTSTFSHLLALISYVWCHDIQHKDTVFD